MTIVVSIGRNVGEEPMDAGWWLRFRTATVDAVATRGFDIVFEGEGNGYFEGNRERSYTVIAAGEGALAGLYYHLAELAHVFGQESIALTTGNTSFPGPGPRTCDDDVLVTCRHTVGADGLWHTYDGGEDR